MFFNAIFFARRPYGASFVCVCAAAFITGGSENLMKRPSNNIGPSRSFRRWFVSTCPKMWSKKKTTMLWGLIVSTCGDENDVIR
jgi:hypothetical protein